MKIIAIRTLSIALLALSVGGLPRTAAAETGHGYTVEITWKHDARAIRRSTRGDGGGPGDGPRVIDRKADVSVSVELTGSIDYTGALRGAAEAGVPDGSSDERYDSWRSYWPQGSRVDSVAVQSAVQFDQATKYNIADGEGSDMVNKKNADRFGRVGHHRKRHELKTDDTDAFKLIGGDIQIDRVAHKLRIVGGGIELRMKEGALSTTTSEVNRMDKPAAAGEWDRSGADPEGQRMIPTLSIYDIEFDIPADKDEFTVTRSLDASRARDPFEFNYGSEWRDENPTIGTFTKRHDATETLTLVVRRRTSAASPAASKPAPSGQAAAGQSPQTGQTPPASVPNPANEAAEAVKKKLRSLLKF